MVVFMLTTRSAPNVVSVSPRDLSATSSRHGTYVDIYGVLRSRSAQYEIQGRTRRDFFEVTFKLYVGVLNSVEVRNERGVAFPPPRTLPCPPLATSVQNQPFIYHLVAVYMVPYSFAWGVCAVFRIPRSLWWLFPVFCSHHCASLGLKVTTEGKRTLLYSR